MISPIFLIGYPACGKTTLGRAVARVRKDVSFTDLDELIVQRSGRSVSEIFAQEGEDAFRRYEAEVLSEMCEPSDTPRLVACGGGTPCFGDNMERMLACGIVVHLVASREKILQRLRLFGSTRPLLADKTEAELAAYVEAQYEQRRAWYERATCQFDSSRLDTPLEIEETVNHFITRFL